MGKSLPCAKMPYSRVPTNCPLKQIENRMRKKMKTKKRQSEKATAKITKVKAQLSMSKTSSKKTN